MEIGAQLYTVRDFTKDEKGIRETLRKVKALGFDTVQLSGLGPIDPAELASLIDELGLKVCVTHVDFHRLRDDLSQVIREHKLYRCPSIGLSIMPEEYRKSIEGVRKFLMEIAPVAHEIKQAGLQFVYHNHNFEFCRFDDRTVMDVLIEESDPEEFHFLPDIYWLQLGGKDPARMIKKLSGRIEAVHFKDLTVDGFTPAFAECGKGSLDLKSCWQACEEAGVRYVLIEQDRCKGDPFESLSISYDYLKKLREECGR